MILAGTGWFFQNLHRIRYFNLYSYL